MAHFAQLDDNNITVQVIVVNNAEITDSNGVEREELGIAFCKALFGQDSRWVQTSYSGSFRKNYAGIGSTYDAQRDAFISPRPFASWVLNETTCQWQAPVAPPADGGPYRWSEPDLAWLPSDPAQPE